MLTFLSKLAAMSVDNIMASHQAQKKLSHIIVEEGSMLLTIDNAMYVLEKKSEGQWMMNFEIFTDEEIKSWVYRDNPLVSISDNILQNIFLLEFKTQKDNEKLTDFHVNYGIARFENGSYASRSRLVFNKSDGSYVQQVLSVLPLQKNLITQALNIILADWILEYPNQSMAYGTCMADIVKKQPISESNMTV